MGVLFYLIFLGGGFVTAVALMLGLRAIKLI